MLFKLEQSTILSFGKELRAVKSWDCVVKS